MSRLGLAAVATVGLLTLTGCGDDPAVGQPVGFASQAVPSVSAVSGTTSAAAAGTVDETDAVLAAYNEYVVESDRFFDESIAQAAAAGAYAGSPELDAILDAVAMGSIRDFDVQTPQSLWEKGGVETVGSPHIAEASVMRLDEPSGQAEVQSCTDVSDVNYLDVAGRPLKASEVPDFLLESVKLSRTSNPRNSDVVRWYVVDRTSQQVGACP